MTSLNLPEPIATYFDADGGDGKASAKYVYTSQPLALEQKDGRYIVTSRLTGNFPGSPVDLRFAFCLERGKIAYLEITP